MRTQFLIAKPSAPFRKFMPVSPLVLLGSLGTAVSTLSMLPHLVHAIRNRRPSGSAFAWAFGAFSSTIWFVYGFAIGDMLVAAPGFVTIPVGLGLAVWVSVSTRRTAREAGLARVVPLRVPAWDAVRTVPTEVEVLEEMFAAAPARVRDRDFGDTLELPRIAA